MNWIYTDKELPKYNEQVIIGYQVERGGILDIENPKVSIGFRVSTDINGEHYNIVSEERVFAAFSSDPFRVIKWMPLPKY